MIASLIVTIAVGAVLLFLAKGYEKTMSLISSRHQRRNSDPPRINADLPRITVMIPTFNEAGTIARKLENLFDSDYPRDLLEIIVVDSSLDETGVIASSYPVKVVRCDAVGKIRAINEGIKLCKTDIVVLTDCDTILDRRSILCLVQSFSTDVGAVGGIVRPKGNGEWFSSMKSSYHEWDWGLREVEGTVDTVCSLDGNLVAFRKSIINEIPGDAFADDMELTFAIRKKGYRCIISRGAVAYQMIPNGLSRDLQRMRRIIKLTILTSLRHSRMLFSTKYGWFSMITFPSRRFLNLLTPFMLAYVAVFLWLYSPLLLLSGIALAIAISILGLRKIGYYWILLLALTLAWLDIFAGNFHRGAVWQKVR